MSSDKKKKRKVEAEAKDDIYDEELGQWADVIGGDGFVADCIEARAEIVRIKVSRSKRLKALRKLYSRVEQVYCELGEILLEPPDKVVDMDPDDLE